jgi:two-component system, response regulator RegA
VSVISGFVIVAKSFLSRIMTSSHSFLIVDDDITFAQMLKRALDRRGFTSWIAQDIATAETLLSQHKMAKAIVDLKIAQESGLVLISRLKEINPAIQIIMLTGYSSISTAVDAIKLGAINYFCKPIEVDDLLKAFDATTIADTIPIPENAPSLDRMEWEYIQKVLQDCNGNISAAARALGVHRRTLQRKLQKRPVKQ